MLCSSHGPHRCSKPPKAPSVWQKSGEGRQGGTCFERRIPPGGVLINKPASGVKHPLVVKPSLKKLRIEKKYKTTTDDAISRSVPGILLRVSSHFICSAPMARPYLSFSLFPPISLVEVRATQKTTPPEHLDLVSALSSVLSNMGLRVENNCCAAVLREKCTTIHSVYTWYQPTRFTKYLLSTAGCRHRNALLLKLFTQVPSHPINGFEGNFFLLDLGACNCDQLHPAE